MDQYQPSHQQQYDDYDCRYQQQVPDVLPSYAASKTPTDPASPHTTIHHSCATDKKYTGSARTAATTSSVVHVRDENTPTDLNAHSESVHYAYNESVPFQERRSELTDCRTNMLSRSELTDCRTNVLTGRRYDEYETYYSIVHERDISC